MTTQPATPQGVDATALAAITRGAAPPPRSALGASLTFGWRAVLKVKHVPEQLVDVTGIPIIFTVMFTYLFGGALAGSTREYVNFLLPGSLTMSVVMVTVYAGVALNSDITTGVFDRFRSLPIWRPAPFLGGLLGDSGRYLISSAIVVGLGLALGFRPRGGVGGVLAAVALLLLFAFALSWAWTALALVVRTPTAVMQIGLLLLFPLSLASNVFVDPKTIPGWLQVFVDINPITDLVTAVRRLMHGTSAGADVGWVLASSAVLLAVFAPLTVYLYRRKT